MKLVEWGKLKFGRGIQDTSLPNIVASIKSNVLNVIGLNLSNMLKEKYSNQTHAAPTPRPPILEQSMVIS